MNGKCAHEFLHCRVRPRLHFFEIPQRIMRKAVNHGNANIHIAMMRIRILPQLARSRREHARRPDILIQRIGLTCIDHDEHTTVPPFLPHLADRVAQVARAYLLVVLKFEKAVTAMAGEVEEDVAGCVGEKVF